ncbi:hypothetical protein M8C21_027127 [Ambrosia artemisiifolia]|uniref:Uncharacterized protein n=1 Tax=Ambrosia artemisiifolia TaxID=4212 RepID=A0AAD5CC14_AMBAR|nr:hypothetical protein M8C21_027127 [Ambrosia artemisiifolia]
MEKVVSFHNSGSRFGNLEQELNEMKKQLREIEEESGCGSDECWWMCRSSFWLLVCFRWRGRGGFGRFANKE